MDKEKCIAKIEKLAGELMEYTGRNIERHISKEDLRKMKMIQRLVHFYMNTFGSYVHNADVYRILSAFAAANGEFKTSRWYREAAIRATKFQRWGDYLVLAYDLHHEFASTMREELLAEALDKLNIVIIMTNKEEESELLCAALNRRGMIQVSKSYLIKGMADFKKVIEIAEKFNILRELSFAHCNKGAVHLLNNEPEESWLHYEAALKIDERIKNYAGVSRDLFGLARLNETKNLPLAIRYLLKSLQLTKKYTSDPREELNTCALLATLYEYAGKRRAAQKLKARAKSLEIKLKYLNL